MRYKLFNTNTNHTFHQSDNLTDTLNMYHKIPRRKHSTVVLLDTDTGELIRIKFPKGQEVHL